MDPDDYFASPSRPGASPPPAPALQQGQDRTTPPVVRRLGPADGWARAGLAHRIMALSAVPLALVQVALAVAVATQPGAPGNAAGGSGTAFLWLGFLSFLPAPPLYYAAARVLRPHPRRGGERAVRHVLASAGTAFSVPVVTAVVVSAAADTADADHVFPVLVLLGLPALLLGLVTSVWGLAVAAGRAADRAAASE